MSLDLYTHGYVLVLSENEKTQTMAHEYIKHGKSTLFAALNVKTRQVKALTQAKHRQQEFLAFRDTLVVETRMQVILENCGDQKTVVAHSKLDALPR